MSLLHSIALAHSVPPIAPLPHFPWHRGLFFPPPTLVNVQIRELVMAEIENNELLSASSYDLSLPEIRSLVMEKV